MSYIDETLIQVKNKYSEQKEYLQAVEEFFTSLYVVLKEEENLLQKYNILNQLLEPNNIIIMKIKWLNDQGEIIINHGYRIQHSNLLGPYKGGLRFAPNVNISILKFLAFEQTFKNALTGLALGGGKGGCDFDPRGKSENEIKNFCIAYMRQLYRHIGASYDVPAGDIGVGAREINYLYNEYRQLVGHDEYGVLTGKSVDNGGSLIRKEATGFGLLYFVNNILLSNEIEIKGKRAIISGAGNVGLHALEKALDLGVRVIGISDIDGYIIDENGIDFPTVRDISTNYGTLKSYLEIHSNAQYFTGSIYDHQIKYDLALPCATQNEIDIKRAKRIVDNGCILVGEGANMPSNNEAVAYFLAHNILFAPAKAANAGGVSTSYFEMLQNANQEKWSAQRVNDELFMTMKNIHDNCRLMCQKYHQDPNNYIFGANAYAFNRIKEKILADSKPENN